MVTGLCYGGTEWVWHDGTSWWWELTTSAKERSTGLYYQLTLPRLAEQEEAVAGLKSVDSWTSKMESDSSV